MRLLERREWPVRAGKNPGCGWTTAAHDDWFREQVEGAIKEADNPNTEWATHEVVKQDMARQRAELLARIDGEGEHEDDES